MCPRTISKCLYIDRVISEYLKTDTISKFIIQTAEKEFGLKGQCTIKTILTLSQHSFSPYHYQGLIASRLNT